MPKPSTDRHLCQLGIDVIKSCFPPLHPQRFCLDVAIRKLRQVIIMDLNGKKCKNFFSNSKTMRSAFKKHLNSPHCYIIHPFSKANGFMEMVFLVLMLFRYSLLGIKYGPAFVQMDMMVNLLWFFFMLSIFVTGYVKYETKEICIHPKAIALHYLKTYFIFDLLLILKTPLRVYINNSTFNFCLLFLTIASYFVRLRTVLLTLDNILLDFGANKLTEFLIYEVLKLAYFLHLITCVFIVIPEHIYPDYPYSWLYGMDDKIHFRYEVYCKGLLVVVCYFFGADYDFEPVDPYENLVLFLLSFIGRLYTLELIARVLAIFGITNVSDSNFEQQLTVLRTYLRSFRLPDKLRQRVLDSFQKRTRKQYFDEEEIQSHLTDHLKAELFLHGAKSLITKHSVLAKIPRSDLFTFLAIMKSKMFFRNDVILMPGNKFDYAYFISFGTVAGYDINGAEFVHLEEGDEFGIAWLAFSHVQTSTIKWIALETTEVYCVKRADLVRYFSHQHEVARYFEAKIKQKFDRYMSSKGEFKTENKDVLLSLRKGEVLEKRRRRLFTLD